MGRRNRVTAAMTAAMILHPLIWVAIGAAGISVVMSIVYGRSAWTGAERFKRLIAIDHELLRKLTAERDDLAAQRDAARREADALREQCGAVRERLEFVLGRARPVREDGDVIAVGSVDPAAGRPVAWSMYLSGAERAWAGGVLAEQSDDVTSPLS
jgi:hypothetical protein